QMVRRIDGVLHDETNNSTTNQALDITQMDPCVQPRTESERNIMLRTSIPKSLVKTALYMEQGHSMPKTTRALMKGMFTQRELTFMNISGRKQSGAKTIVGTLDPVRLSSIIDFVVERFKCSEGAVRAEIGKKLRDTQNRKRNPLMTSDKSTP
ncbi:unnamed protein product, partial [Owenia fusiformis]